MSLRFGSTTTTNHAVQSSGLVTVPSFPMTMSLWFYSNKTTGVREPLIEFQATDPVAEDFFGFNLTMLSNATTTSRRISAATYDPTNTILRAQTATGAGNGWATSTWNHAAGVFTSSLRTAYLNGGSSGTESTTVTAPGGLIDPMISINQVQTESGAGYGQFGHDASNQEIRMAEVAIWNTDLTSEEISSLAKGFCPKLIRPDYLFFYAPLIRTTGSSIFEATGIPMTAYNFGSPFTPTTEPHPRRIG